MMLDFALAIYIEFLGWLCGYVTARKRDWRKRHRIPRQANIT